MQAHFFTDSWRKPAEDVQSFIEKQRVSGLKLSSQESEALKKVCSLDDLLGLTRKIQANWAEKRGAKARDTFQESVEAFADTWGDLANAVLSVAPFGTGDLAWGVIGALLTVLMGESTLKMKIESSKIFANMLSDDVTRLWGTSIGWRRCFVK